MTLILARMLATTRSHRLWEVLSAFPPSVSKDARAQFVEQAGSALRSHPRLLLTGLRLPVSRFLHPNPRLRVGFRVGLLLRFPLRHPAWPRSRRIAHPGAMFLL